MSKFAAGTSVPVERSKGQIEKLLMDYGASHFSYTVGPRAAAVSFQVGTRVIKLRIGLPDPEEFRLDGRGRERTSNQIQALVEQATRQSWRILRLVIQAKLEAVATGISTLDEEFLAWVVAANGETVGDILAAQLESKAPLQLTSGK